MTINLYRNNSPQTKAVKSLVSAGSVTGELREDSSITDPAIVFTFSGVPNFNYFDIPDFSRKYFVTDLTSVGNSLWLVEGHCDVLSSFWNEIKECECIIGRCASNRNPLLIDNKLLVTARSRYAVQKSTLQPLMGGTATKRYVLILPGSGTGT